jgi:recombination protein RecT
MSERKQFELMALEAKGAFLKVSDEATFSKEIMYALQILRGSSYLQRCAPQTIKNAVTNIALTGATLNPALQQAFLIPRNIMVDGKKVMSCCLDFSYRGLIKIATDTGSVTHWDAVEVFEGDDFGIIQGSENPHVHHIPKFPRDPQAPLIAVYSRATLHNGDKSFLVMERHEIEATRKTSQCPESPAWKNQYGEMSKKTVMKRHYKTLPQTDRMAEAIQVLNEHEGFEVKKKGDKAKDILNRFGCDNSEEAEYTDMNETPRGEEASVEKKPEAAPGSPEKKEAAKPKGSASPAQIKKIQTVMSEMGLKSEDEQLDWITFNFEIKIPAVDGLSKDQANQIIKGLEKTGKK